MGNYASGKDAYGISDRSGFRYRLRDMKVEWNGLKVGHDEYESKHPQLDPRRKVIDPQALRNPRPDPTLVDTRTIQWGWNPVGLYDNGGLNTNDLVGTGAVGSVTVVTA
jgi:hypothetical protein